VQGAVVHDAAPHGSGGDRDEVEERQHEHQLVHEVHAAALGTALKLEGKLLW